MADFDYGNARLRAMKSQLLSHQTLATLAGMESITELINALTRTPYRGAMESALVQFEGRKAIAHARRTNLIEMVAKIRRFYSGRAAELAAWVWRRYDVTNVKGILRGLRQQVPANEIRAGMLPIGELQPAELDILAQTAHPRAAIDLLATWRMPLAQPLLTLRIERPGTDLSEMELALEKWYFRAALAAAKENGGSLRQSLMVHADRINILTALRLIDETEAILYLRQHFGTQAATPLWVGPGHIDFRLLNEAAEQESVTRAVELLSHTTYGPDLMQAQSQYQASHRLSDFEYALQRRQLAHAASLLRWDTLGIGVLIGFMALKMNELANLRRIVHGISMEEPADRIRGEMVIADL